MFAQHERDARQPVPDERVAALLEAAAAPAERGPIPRETDALAAFRTANHAPLPRPSRRSGMFGSRPRLRIAAAAAMGTGVLLTGGVATAAAGALPGAAQGTASEMLARVGVTVPDAAEQSTGHADERGPAGDPDAASNAGAEGSESADGEGKGNAVSELARTTESQGVDKGAEISGYASEGRSRAGENSTTERPGKPTTADESEGHTEVDTPNRGGTDRSPTDSDTAGDDGAPESPQAAESNQSDANTASEADGDRDRRRATESDAEAADNAGHGDSDAASRNP